MNIKWMMVPKNVSLFYCSSCEYRKLIRLQTSLVHSSFHYRCFQVRWHILFFRNIDSQFFLIGHFHILISSWREHNSIVKILNYSKVSTFLNASFGCLWTSIQFWKLWLNLNRIFPIFFRFFNTSIRFELNSGIETIA